MLAVIYTFDKTITAIPWCVGGIALVVAILLLRRPVNLRVKLVAWLIALLALGAFAPSMQNDRIEITPESFSLRTGAWWSPNEHRFLFRDAVRVEIVTRPGRKGRLRKYMRVTLKNGLYDDVPMGDLFRAHEVDILQAVQDAINKAGVASSGRVPFQFPAPGEPGSVIASA